MLAKLSLFWVPTSGCAGRRWLRALGWGFSALSLGFVLGEAFSCALVGLLRGIQLWLGCICSGEIFEEPLVEVMAWLPMSWFLFRRSLQG